jgi:hypothetical protein
MFFYTDGIRRKGKRTLDNFDNFDNFVIVSHQCKTQLILIENERNLH